jgi:DNA-binding transcriptional regulator YhcF (GntR family)
VTDPLDEIAGTLRGRVLRGLQAGTLRAGDRLPSTRELVAEFAVDHRTILAAYRRIAEEGLVELRERGGIYVAPRPDGPGVAALPESWIVDVLTEGFAREIPAPELHEWLRRCTETLRLRAVVVTSTPDQLAGLCRELRDDFGLEAEGLLADELDAASDAASDGATLPLPLRRADLLVTTAAHATRVSALGASLRRPVVAIEVRPDLAGGEWALLLRRPVYAVVASEAFGVMLREFFAGTPGVENLRVLVFGRDDLSTIPAGAPTYITRQVRDALGGTPVRGHILPAARTIAPTSARALFAYIVRANLEAMARLTR